MTSNCLSPRRPIALIATLALIAHSGCGIGGGKTTYQANKENVANAQELLTSKGATVKRTKGMMGPAWAVSFPQGKIDEEVIGALRKLRSIAELDLSKSDVTDEQLKVIGNPKDFGGELRLVILTDTAVSDAGLQGLEQIVFLQKIDAKGSKITKAGVDQMNAVRKKNPIILDSLRTVKVSL